VGPAWRFTRNFEVRGGVGLEFMSGTVDAGTSQTSHNLDFSRTMPTAFAAVQWAWAKKGSTSQNRVRVGAELRYAFDHDVAFSEVQKVIQVAGFSAGVFVGVEFPLIPSRAPPLSL